MTQLIDMHDYDSSHDPSMPVLEIGLSHILEVQPLTKVIALVDSGSDVTTIPLKILQKVNAIRVGERYIVGVTGDRRLVRLYSVKIHIGSHSSYDIDAVANTVNQETLLGRDILNQLEVTLNGFAGVTEIRV
ncbi:MAG: hypothetical protein AAF639_24655 [Chloroflexota bacterium]